MSKQQKVKTDLLYKRFIIIPTVLNTGSQDVVVTGGYHNVESTSQPWHLDVVQQFSTAVFLTQPF